MKWETAVSIPDHEKCIICAAPHTSNWDFLIGKLFYASIGRDTGFLMKKDWFFFPVGILLRYMGGIPVYRDRKTSLVENLVKLIKKEKTFHVAITPEGTRAANPNWKKGFYFIALKAGIPIVLVGIDYKKKRVVMEKEIIPTGNYRKDLKEIQDYYRQFTGKYPEKFVLK